MDETTDRPPDPKGLVAPPAPPDDAPPSYSSLSLLAVGALSLAVAYTVVVVGGGAIALFYRQPWVLPPWSLAVPLAAVVLCWAARVQIGNSEGALTGTRLTSWGMWLSLIVGLLYGAYYSACYLSVTQMAEGVADQWFDDLKNGRLDKAFLLGQPPPRPADNAGLRARLELEFDRGPEGSGALTAFRRSPFVREVLQGGTATRTQFLGVKEWGNTGDGYQVQLTYRISTPYMSSEEDLTVVSTDKADDSGGRQWYVRIPQTTSAPVLTAEGQHMTNQVGDARTLAQQWLGEVGAWHWEPAYRYTLPPAERNLPKDDPKFVEGLKAFHDGALVRAEPPTFWASDKDKDAIVADVKSMFGRGGANPDKMSLALAPPTYQREQDRIRIGVDVQIPMPPRYMVQAQLMVVAVVPPDGDPAPADWRIESLDLISGKSMNSGGPSSSPGLPGMTKP